MNYTFVCEKQGSTFCEQIRASSLREATSRWHEESASRPGPLSDLDLMPPMPLEGLHNVWCHTGSDPEGQSFFCNIVATSEVPEHVHRTQLLTEEPDLESVEVLPGRGFGPVFFGMTIDEAEVALGPIVESTLRDDGGERSLHVAYSDVGIHLFFEEGGDGGEFLLYSIEVDEDCPCDLFGEPLFPKSRDQVAELLDRHLTEDGLAEIEEERDEETQEIRLEVFPLGMTFYFDLTSEELTQVHWGVLFDENDEEIWPEPEE
jgi:hypothetical protein